MGWDGSGNFDRVHNWADDEAASIDITASRFDAEHDAFATGLENCLTRDGQNSPTANISWNSMKLTSLGTDTAATSAATVLQAQSGTLDYAADTGAANAYLVAPTPAYTAYTTGAKVKFKPTNNNTGASTINVSSLGAKNIKLLDGTDPTRNQINTNSIHELVYDGTNYVLLNPANPFMGVTLTGGTVTVATSTNTAIPFTTELLDTDSFHDNATNNTRITIPTGCTGLYATFYLYIQLSSNTTGYRAASLYRNGSSIAGFMNQDDPQTGGISTRLIYASPAYPLTDGDYFESYAWQNSGGNLTASNCTFGMVVHR